MVTINQYYEKYLPLDDIVYKPNEINVDTLLTRLCIDENGKAKIEYTDIVIFDHFRLIEKSDVLNKRIIFIDDRYHYFQRINKGRPSENQEKDNIIKMSNSCGNDIAYVKYDDYYQYGEKGDRIKIIFSGNTAYFIRFYKSYCRKSMNCYHSYLEAINDHFYHLLRDYFGYQCNFDSTIVKNINNYVLKKFNFFKSEGEFNDYMIEMYNKCVSKGKKLDSNKMKRSVLKKMDSWFHNNEKYITNKYKNSIEASSILSSIVILPHYGILTRKCENGYETGIRYITAIIKFNNSSSRNAVKNIIEDNKDLILNTVDDHLFIDSDIRKIKKVLYIFNMIMCSDNSVEITYRIKGLKYDTYEDEEESYEDEDFDDKFLDDIEDENYDYF